MRVAILEDDPDQADLTQLWLTNAGYSVFCFADGASFLRAVRRDSFDLYLLDWVLPDMSGMKVLSTLRADRDDRTPVIVTTVKNDEQDIVEALETGADDYLAKPVRRAELVARLHAILRRSSGLGVGSQVLEMSPYRIDLANKSVSVNDQAIELTGREFALAAFFFRNVGKMMSRSHILEQIWGIDSADISTRTVDTHVSRLRKKMRLNDADRWKLSSVYQHGYRLEQCDLPDSGASLRRTGEGSQ